MVKVVRGVKVIKVVRMYNFDNFYHYTTLANSFESLPGLPFSSSVSAHIFLTHVPGSLYDPALFVPTLVSALSLFPTVPSIHNLSDAEFVLYTHPYLLSYVLIDNIGEEYPEYYPKLSIEWISQIRISRIIPRGQIPMKVQLK